MHHRYICQSDIFLLLKERFVQFRKTTKGWRSSASARYFTRGLPDVRSGKAEFGEAQEGHEGICSAAIIFSYAKFSSLTENTSPDFTGYKIWR
ncbi:hypothetical protein BES34_015905 [Leptospira inadai serovar Lyme]|uniref:Uncharacterized protein n=1 Tax=Leptospira inadai serovar Lyme TaxID=293084 RepID=A0ABX4YFL7_9LEPT|nr:hypothetical protein BES34_015905 [Leptospira inadai serovar Lyme]